MVLLTMTTSIVEALQTLHEVQLSQTKVETGDVTAADEPSLSNAAVGNPISHGQIIDTWTEFKANAHHEYTLEALLRGATVYVPSPPPKPEPTDEYKALMARLRHDEEERSYERMLKAAPMRETYMQRSAPAPMAHYFAEVNKPTRQSDIGDDGIDHSEIQKQITLVINFLVSIAGCAAAIWIAAQWWSTTARLFVTLGGSLIVAIAEVVVYSAYSWRMEQGDKKQKAVKEVQEVIKTWVVGEKEKESDEPVLIQPKGSKADPNLRKREANLT